MIPKTIKSPLNITISGFGDVGQTYAAALLEQGFEPIIFHPAPKAIALKSAKRLDLTIQTNPSKAFSECNLVLNVTPGSQALSAALLALPFLKPDTLFADFSSAAPKALLDAAAHFAPNCYVDVAIMGSVSIHKHKTPLITSGAGALHLQQILNPLGFQIEVLADSQPGEATALKLVRSILTKGMDAVIVECLLIAEALGLRNTLLGQIKDLDKSTLSELISMFISTHAPHALRRQQEMQTIEETLSDLGVPLIVTQSVIKRYSRTIATLGSNASLPSNPKGESLYDRVLPWMLKAERRTPIE